MMHFCFTKTLKKDSESVAGCVILLKCGFSSFSLLSNAALAERDLLC